MMHIGRCNHLQSPPRGIDSHRIMTTTAHSSSSDSADLALNILLVEDNDLDVLSLQRAIKKAKLPHRMAVAGTAEQALAVLQDREEAIHLPKARRMVLLDLNLPEVSGFDLLRRIREDETLAHTLVIVLTSSDVVRDKYQAFRHNVAGYLIKPVEQEAFSELVEALHKYWTTSELPPESN